MTDWQAQDDALVREFELPSFVAAIDFVDRLAELAESENHHPDIDVRYRRVTVRWTTHSKAGSPRRTARWRSGRPLLPPRSP